MHVAVRTNWFWALWNYMRKGVGKQDVSFLPNLLFCNSSCSLDSWIWVKEAAVVTWLCCYTEVGMKNGVCILVAPQSLQPQHTLNPLLGLSLLLHLSLNRNLEPFGPFVIFYEHTNSLAILPHFFLRLSLGPFGWLPHVPVSAVLGCWCMFSNSL